MESPYTPPSSSTEESQVDDQAQPNGLKGWLILPMLGLIITPINLSILLVTTFIPIFTDGTWTILTSPSSEAYHHLWAPLLIFESIGNFAFLIGSVFLLVWFFKKSRKLPKYIIIFYIANLLFVTADYIFGNLIPIVAESNQAESLREIVKSFIGAVIWVPYFLKSVRVKNTFKN